MFKFDIKLEYVLALISYCWLMFLCAILCRYFIYWARNCTVGDETTNDTESMDVNPVSMAFAHIISKLARPETVRRPETKDCNGSKTNTNINEP